MIKLPLRHLNRYRQIATLLFKYGRSDLVERSGFAEHLVTSHANNANGRVASHDWDHTDGDDPAKHHQMEKSGAKPQELVEDLEELGPTYIKLGQLLSTRPDFLPPQYCSALSRLQDNAEPVETREIFRIVEEELGLQPELLFAKFDPEPLATASLGQVHRAKMKDGREVVVKVQRPGIVEQIRDDIEAMEELASFCSAFEFGRDYQLEHLVESLKFSLESELDYLNEARNAKTLADNLEGFESIIVPLPIDSHSSTRVLTMEFIESEKITELPRNRLTCEHSKQLASELFRAFLHQILVHGAFHADPHPGNVGLTGEDQIVLMDHGLVVKVSQRLQGALIKLLLAISDGNGTTAAEIAEETGVVGDQYEPEKFTAIIERIVAENINRSVDQMNAGMVLMQIQKTAGKHDLQMPQEVILLGRALMHLERVVSALDSEFDPNSAIREHTMEVMREHSGQKVSLTNMYQTLLETSEFALKLPDRANKFAELLANNQLKLEVEAFDQGKFIHGLNKVANRISAGLIIAAMIVAAALMMNLETSWSIMGYPALAFLFLFMAALAGGVLVWRAIVSDRLES